MKINALQDLFAESITKSASKQTYYTIGFLVDRERVTDAYRAYAYFRWVDDTLDEGFVSTAKRLDFLERQKSLLDSCYRGSFPQNTTMEENMLIELARQDHANNSGLQSYLRNMMQVMDFDAMRRGKLISQAELNEYTRWLATAVTEAMHYFIGHNSYAPHDETRYLAVSGAHITHMLRDTFDDLEAGYYNIPREVLEANQIGPRDIRSKAYCAWVKSRVQLARSCFQTGRDYLARVGERRCQLAGLAYTARFEWMLDTIEQEDYCLRPDYSERKSFGAGIQMGLSILSSVLNTHRMKSLPQPVISQSLREL
jgi:phytoene/squalene synthetase